MKRKDFIEQKFYNIKCGSCPHAKFCHEECTTCEEFDDKLDSVLKEQIIFDYFGNEVKPGDHVVLLYKSYGFRCISRAYFLNVIYKGYGPHGFMFDHPNRPKYVRELAIKEPQLIKIDWTRRRTYA